MNAPYQWLICKVCRNFKLVTVNGTCKDCKGREDK